MSGHTPGPWVSVRYPNGTYSVETQKATVADRLTVKADAILCAAAPELLFCCKKLLSAYEKRESIPDGWVSEIRAAIAKAEGK